MGARATHPRVVGEPVDGDPTPRLERGGEGDRARGGESARALHRGRDHVIHRARSARRKLGVRGPSRGGHERRYEQPPTDFGQVRSQRRGRAVARQGVRVRAKPRAGIARAERGGPFERPESETEGRMVSQGRSAGRAARRRRLSFFVPTGVRSRNNAGEAVAEKICRREG